MVIETLLALADAPHFNSVLDKPFNHKRRFIIYSAYSVKHKHQQNFKFSSECRLFQILYCVAVFSRNLKAGYAFFLKLLNYYPAVAVSKFSARLLLHRNIVL